MHNKSFRLLLAHGLAQAIVLRIIRIYVFMLPTERVVRSGSDVPAHDVLRYLRRHALAPGREFMTSAKLLRERAGRR